jgi:hypothetical protein
MLIAALEAAMQAGQIVRVDSTALAHALLAVLHESATMILFATDQPAERERVGAVVEALIGGCERRERAPPRRGLRPTIGNISFTPTGSGPVKLWRRRAEPRQRGEPSVADPSFPIVRCQEDQMSRKRIAVVALTVSAAISALGSGPAEALKGCVRAPSPALTTGHRGEQILLHLEPGKNKRVLRKLRPNTLVWIATTPQLRRVCPVHGYYPVMYETRKTYEEIWGWIAAGRLRL